MLMQEAGAAGGTHERECAAVWLAAVLLSAAPTFVLQYFAIQYGIFLLLLWRRRFLNWFLDWHWGVGLAIRTII